jgi:ubiquinone/menaquinone biosynthesis C-methylase UbiE
MAISAVIKELSPPILLKGFKYTLKTLKKLNGLSQAQNSTPDCQDIEVYWDSKIAKVLETWGEGNVWQEIQFLMVNCRGRVLDIACGTGKTIEINSRFPNVEIYGCDISDFLIQKAIERGISKNCLKVCDATKTDYQDNYFDYAYSIGSLEHFTEEGIIQFLSECHRIVQGNSFHMIPVCRSQKDEGWIRTSQSYYNNSVNWWLNKFQSVYEKVYVLDSCWQDDISVGKWFVCVKG